MWRSYITEYICHLLVHRSVFQLLFLLCYMIKCNFASSVSGDLDESAIKLALCGLSYTVYACTLYNVEMKWNKMFGLKQTKIQELTIYMPNDFLLLSKQPSGQNTWYILTYWLFYYCRQPGYSLYYSTVTPTPGPVSPICCSVGISSSSRGVTGAAPVLSETGCFGVRR